MTHVVFPAVEASGEAHDAGETAPVDLALPASPSPYAQVMAALAELREVVRMAERASTLRFV